MMHYYFLGNIIYILLYTVNANVDLENGHFYDFGHKNVNEKSNPYKDIINNVELIKKECGSLCNIDPSTYQPISDDSKFYYVPIKKEVNCQKLWNNSIFDEKGKFTKAPQKIPKYLRGYFTHHSNLVDIKPLYFDEITDSIWNQTFNKWSWTKEGINQHMTWIEKGQLNAIYGKDVMHRIQYLAEKYITVRNRHILIIGSILPWIESLLLTMDAAHITTLEYEPYPSTHPKITTISPQDFSKLVISNKAPMFDAMITFSSIEHSGLGRYGDQLNPWGDIIAMGRAWCQMKPGAMALVGVPTSKDTICFNGARMYGSFLYQYLFANWRQIYSEGNPYELLNGEVNCRVTHNVQPIHVLQK